VVRIRDTARAAGSKTVATAVVLADRGIGVLGLGFVAAAGSSIAAWRSERLGPLGPSLLWGGLLAAITLWVLVLALPGGFRVLARPLRVIHAEWVDLRLNRLIQSLVRFRQAPGAMAVAFFGAIVRSWPSTWPSPRRCISRSRSDISPFSCPSPSSSR
jgi:hypothetical protein